MIPALCYGLLIVAWVIDLLTPQLFVAAILLNGPIALSSLALRPSVTVWLIVAAEVANVVAAYVNGVHDGYHWNGIAIGDRILSGASFVLVGSLAIRTQANARRAGESEERRRQIVRERALRRAMERVRASLNMELILRSAVREASELTGADVATILVRESSFDVADTYELQHGASEARIERRRLTAAESSLVERARSSKVVVAVSKDDPLGRLVGSNALVASLETDGGETALVLAWDEHQPHAQEREEVQVFADNLSVALAQAKLFVRLAAQNEEIARSKDELQKRNDVIRDLVYALAHDLRTPLVAADVTMHQALDGEYGDLPDPYVRVLRTSLASNHDARRLLETLLLVARYEAGEDSRAFAPFQTGPLLQRVVDEMSPIARQRGIDLSLAVASGGELIGDEDELRRAISNLVGNALEATPQGGHVRVASTFAGAFVVEVSDDGYGVAPERRVHLFERFARVRSGGGTGLGLYIVRRIAEKYAGRVEYAPNEPQGSRFVLTIPVNVRS